MEPVRDTTVIACSLEQAELPERRQRWRALADHALLDLASTHGGLRLRFRAEPGVEAELHDLAGLERACCAFADWTVRAGGGEVVLTVGGDSEEAVAAVRGMFRSLHPVPASGSSRLS
jgi:hypothetical protein